MSRLIICALLIAFANFGCALTTKQSDSSTGDVPPIYDTHKTYDAKVEQYKKDYGNWLNKRRTVYRNWKESIRGPALAKVSVEQWNEYHTSVETVCVAKPDSSSPTHSECRSALFEELLHTVDDGYQSLEEYETENGAGPRPEYPKYNRAPSPPTKQDIEYQSAKRECADKGGTWISFMHIHGTDFWGNGMRCFKGDVYRLSPRPEHDDPIWDSLLHYDIYVKHDRRSKELLEFARTDPIDWRDLAR